MKASPVNPTLGTHMARRRTALGISQSGAAKLAGVSRGAWITWEKDSSIPESFNWSKIEFVLRWEEGSAESALAGGEPTPRVAEPDDDTTVVPLRPKSTPEDEDDETIRDLRSAPIADDMRTLLIENYRAERARDALLRQHEDEERRRRYLKIAQAAGE